MTDTGVPIQSLIHGRQEWRLLGRVIITSERKHPWEIRKVPGARVTKFYWRWEQTRPVVRESR